MTVVVERIEPPELFDWFVELRSDLGMNVVPLGPSAGDRGAPGAAQQRDRVPAVATATSRAAASRSSSSASARRCPAGPATLGLRAGAPILPVGVYFTRQVNGHHAIVRPPLDAERRGKLREDVTRLTQDLAHELEYLIRRAPEQWHLFQPNWPSDPGYRQLTLDPSELDGAVDARDRAAADPDVVAVGGHVDPAGRPSAVPWLATYGAARRPVRAATGRPRR